MLVKEWMSKRVIALEVTSTVQEALKCLREHKISKLPVMNSGELVGIITDGDLRRFWPSAADTLTEIKSLLELATRMDVGAIMTKAPITVPPDYTLQETAEVLLDHNISGCPVVDHDGKVVGMITRNDLFKAIVSQSGVRKKGFQFGFLMEDRPGSLREVTDVVRKHGARVASIMSSNQDVPDGLRHVSIVAFDIDRHKLPQIKQELEQTCRILYVVDRRENRREISTNR